MKKVYSFLAASTLMIGMQAQNFDWAQRGGHYAYDYGYGIATDNTGNVYVAGKYEEVNADFSGTLLPCAGNHDIFLAQYSAAGTLNWIRTAGGTSGDYALSVACDNAAVYIAGEVEGVNETIYFPGSTTTLLCQASNDIFVAKYDLSGNLLWARSAGGFGYEKALGVSCDPSGNVYICGLFQGSTTFGGTTTISSTTSNENDIFLAKYDMNGVFQWVQHAGSAGRDEAKSVKCDAAGNIYICGLYSAGCVFGSQPALTTYNSTAYFDAFIAKYSPSGSLIWVKTAGGDYDDVAWSLTMDNAGKVFIAGEFNAYAVFDAIPLVTAGNADAFVACYNASGNVQWATKAGGTSATSANNLVTRARGIGCDGNNLYITGQFGATAEFGSVSLTAADSSDIFFASLDNYGNFLRATSVGGAADAFEDLGFESGIAICAEPAGNVYATGSTLNGGIFGGTTVNAFDRTDVFVTKLSLMTGMDDLANEQRDIYVYPNPSSGVVNVKSSAVSGNASTVKVYNVMGQKVLISAINFQLSTLSLDLSAQEKGIYFIEIKSEDESISRGKIVIQ